MTHSRIQKYVQFLNYKTERLCEGVLKDNIKIDFTETEYMIMDLMLTTQGREGYAVAQLVEALRYKSEGRGFDSRWSHWNFSVI